VVKFVRFLFVTWCVVTYILAFIFTSGGRDPRNTAILLSTGLIFYIFAAAAL